VQLTTRLNLQSTDHEKIPARNSIYAHKQGSAMSDNFLLAILKAFVPQMNKQPQGTSLKSNVLL
jgi:hypothetical protein